MDARETDLPLVIQGGMGAAVSGWALARAVSLRGQLGVVSGTGADAAFARRLQLGDVGGHLRRAIDAFPLPEMAHRVRDRYFRAHGKAPEAPFKSKPMPMLRPSKALTELNVLANFAEVYLAKFGHQGRIGINLLEKIQLPTLPALFGAMLAGVDFVLIGAGIPRQIPAVLDSLSRLEPTQLRLDVSGAEPGEEFFAELDPRDYAPEALERLNRPQFIAIVSSTALATTLVRKCSPPVDGLVIEGPTAGGHNAPPRGTLILDDNREPIYGAKDLPDLEAIRALGVPFWLAGSYGSPEKLREAIGLGATGIQVGTAFAFCEESGITPELKREVLQQSAAGTLQVFTDSQASPTGFPFKVIHIDATLSEPSVFEGRTRICDLGYLRQLYRKEDGTVGYRCPGEPIDDFVAKGGNSGDCSGRKCLCNGLMATVGLGQVRKGVAEPPIVTAGDDAASVAAFLPPGRTTYNAGDVLDKLLGTCPQPAA